MQYPDPFDQMQTRKQALIDKLSGGTATGPTSIAPTTPPPIVTDAAPAPTSGQYANKLTAWDPRKLADPNKRDPKYDFGRIAQDYADTPEGLTALAKDPRFAAMGFALEPNSLKNGVIRSSDGGLVDVGIGFGGGGGRGWGWGGVGGETPQAMGGGTPQFAGSTIHPMLQGDAQGGIASALQNIGQLAQPSRLQQLIAALQQGGQA